MEAIVVYLFKMFICSGLLYGYYRVALYNESFHRWNRFYLLAALLISLAAPLIKIPMVATAGETDLATAVALLPWNNNEVSSVPNLLSKQEIVLLLTSAISAFLFVRVVAGIIKIIVIFYRSPVNSYNAHIQLVYTKITQAPFSFFNWLFWRIDIDPASETGQRILSHELTHIREKHSIDKVITSFVCSIFWFNPFFWLIRSELSTIHEFLADRKAIKQQDGASFASMILQSVSLHKTINNGLINPFFTSQIKRRLFMITTSKHPRYSYLRRISGLCIMISAAIVLTLSIQEAEAQQPGNTKSVKSKDITARQSDSINKVILVDEIVVRAEAENRLISDTLIFNKNGNKRIVIRNYDGKANDSNTTRVFISELNPEKTPLYVLDGKEIEAEKMKDIKPGSIQSINVLKGESALKKYGENAKDGAIEITMRKPGELPASKEVIVSGYESKKGDFGTENKINPKVNPVFILNDKEITSEEMNKIKPNDIESVNVLKGEHATKKYGEKGKDGIVEIVLKKKIT